MSTCVGLIGLVQVGLSLAIAADKRGLPSQPSTSTPKKMTMFDTSKVYIEAVENGDLSVLVERLFWTTSPSSLAMFHAIVLCLATSLAPQCNPDLSDVKAMAVTITKHLKKGALTASDSITYLGSTERLLTQVRAREAMDSS